MTAPLGRAFIEVLADLKKFPADLKKKLQSGVDDAAKSTTFKEFENKAGKAGEEAGKEIEKGVEKGLDSRKGELRKAGERHANTFGGGFLTRLRTIMLSRGGLYTALGLAAGSLGGYTSGALPGILATIPALAVAAAGSIGTLVLATHGFAAAVGAGIAGDTQKWNEALAKLAPSAQAVAKEIVGLKGAFVGAQQAIQQQFFAPLQGSFQQLARSLIPIARNQLAQLAGTFGGLGASLLGGISSKAGSGALGVIFDQLNKGLVPFIPLMGKAVELFLRIGAVAAPFISAIAGDFAKSFEKFLINLDKSLGDGGIIQFFKTAGDVLSSFAPALGSVLRLITTVFGGLSDTGPTTLILLKDLADLLTNVLGPAMPGIAALLKAFGGGLGDILTAFTPGALAIGKALGKVFEAWAPWIKKVLDALIPLFNNASQWLTEGGPKLADIFSRLGEDLFPLLVQILDDLDPLWNQLGDTIIAWVDNVLPEMPGLLDAVFKVFLALLPILPPLVDDLVQLLGFVADILPLLPPFIKLFIQVADIVAVNVGWWSTLIGWILTLLNVVKDFSMGGVIGQLQMVADVVDTLAGGFQKLLEKIGILDSKKSAILRLPGAGTSGSGGTVPKAYAGGGRVTQPTLAMIGEGGSPEAIVPMGSAAEAQRVASQTGLLSLIGSAPRGGNGGITVRVYLGTREITDIIRVEVDDALDGQAGALAAGTR
jgi:phage-related protein